MTIEIMWFQKFNGLLKFVFFRLNVIYIHNSHVLSSRRKVKLRSLGFICFLTLSLSVLTVL